MYFELKQKNIKKYEKAYDAVVDPDIRKDIILTAFNNGDLYWVANSNFNKLIKDIKKLVTVLMSDNYWKTYVKDVVKDRKRFERKFRKNPTVLDRMLNFLDGLRKASFDDIMRG